MFSSSAFSSVPPRIQQTRSSDYSHPGVNGHGNPSFSLSVPVPFPVSGGKGEAGFPKLGETISLPSHCLSDQPYWDFNLGSTY